MTAAASPAMTCPASIYIPARVVTIIVAATALSVVKGREPGIPIRKVARFRGRLSGKVVAPFAPLRIASEGRLG